MKVLFSSRLTQIGKTSLHTLFTTLETMDVPTTLLVMSFPSSTQDVFFVSYWFGGSSRHASIHVFFV